MAAFQPSEDNTHDLGTSSATWKDLYIKNIISSGETRFNVTDPADGKYTVVDGDHIIIHNDTTEGVVLPAPSTTNAGRELIIVNTNTNAGQNMSIKPAGDNQLYVGGVLRAANDGYSLSPSATLRLISTGSFWYGIAA